MAMPSQHWPLFDLRITTPRFEFRYPDRRRPLRARRPPPRRYPRPFDHAIHRPWTRIESPELEHNALRYWWSRRAGVPDDWSLNFRVFVNGESSACKTSAPKHFTITCTVTTGSWLVQRAQGHGIGKAMRAAVLHLVFAGLDAVEAYTDVFEDNPSSLGVRARSAMNRTGTSVRSRGREPARCSTS